MAAEEKVSIVALIINLFTQKIEEHTYARMHFRIPLAALNATEYETTDIRKGGHYM